MCTNKQGNKCTINNGECIGENECEELIWMQNFWEDYKTEETQCLDNYSLT